MNKFYKINNSIEQTKAKLKSHIYHKLALEEIDKLSDYQGEILEVAKSGHKHFILDEVEDNLLKYIEEDENILIIQSGEYKYNLGMLAVKYKLEKVILKALENPIASTQQDCEGLNIGMHLAYPYKMEDLLMIALDNEVASLQQDKDGLNMGMYAADTRLERATLKALENKQASLQRCKHMGKNIGMYAAASKMETAVLKALDNHDASLQRDKIFKGNLGMFCAMEGLEDATIKALQNYEAAVMQDDNGWNIGMHAIKEGLLRAGSLALENDVAREQKSKNGKSMRSLCLDKGDQKLFVKSLTLSANKKNESCEQEIGTQSTDENIDSTDVVEIEASL